MNGISEKEQSYSNPELWRSVVEHGAAVIPAPLPSTVWQHLYDALDLFTKHVAISVKYAETFNRAAKEWQERSGLSLQFSGYFSPYFRNRLGQKDKDQKAIFQICEPYYRYLSRTHPELLAVQEFGSLVEGTLAAMQSVYCAVLPHILSLNLEHSEFLSAIRPIDGLPPIALRLLHYESDSHFFTDPHVDKSAVTIILNTDDPLDDPCLTFAPADSTNPLLSQFVPVPVQRDQSILFLGAAGREAGFSGLRPAVHAVKPAKANRVRHSAIFFWLLPGIDLRTFSTNVSFIDDLGRARNAQPRRIA